MPSSFIVPAVNHGAMHVAVLGSGKHLIIGIHGYARSGAFFRPLVTPGIKIMAPDLPFHGQTQWMQPKYSVGQLLDGIEYIRKKNGSERFTLLGHSMGARFALAMAGSLLPRLHAVVLLAPDGLATSGLGGLDYVPEQLIRILERSAGSEKIWFSLVAALRKAKVINPVQERFIRRNLGDPNRRAALFGTWRAVQEAGLQMESSSQLLAASGLPIGVAWGNTDPLIQEKKLWNWLAGIPQIQPFIYEGGHIPNWEEVTPFLDRFIYGGFEGGNHFVN